MFGLTWRPGRLEALLARPREQVSPVLVLIDEVYKKEGVALLDELNRRSAGLARISNTYAPVLRKQCEQMGMQVKEIEADFQSLVAMGDSDKLRRFMDDLRNKYGGLIQEAMRQVSLDPKLISNELFAQTHPEVVHDEFGNLLVDSAGQQSSDQSERRES